MLLCLCGVILHDSGGKCLGTECYKCQIHIPLVQPAAEQLGLAGCKCLLRHMGCRSALCMAQQIWLDCLLRPCWPYRTRCLWKVPLGTYIYIFLNLMFNYNLNLHVPFFSLVMMMKR